ncbi:MAG: hypothetical protein IJB37_07320 [Peptococcaceae bacterium]|nr:hypothetical protein [Peptococcaceae bacterium]MBQ3206344.1 hypothetical protein [Peptococcaceae bacterium]MBQ6853141.1 hypothetical protein [Peptococcaceae bacterium]
MKKSKTMRAASFLLVLTLMTSCFVGSTFAKYTSTASGTATATVAKWSIKVGDTDIVATDTVTFDLFATVNDTDGSDEGDVLDGKVAPGTQGSFTIELKNESEVTANYVIAFDETLNNIPIEFSVDGTTWKNSIDDLNDTLAYGAGATSATKTVQWRWVYDPTTSTVYSGRNDVSDTSLGSSPVTATITATITAEQVD